MALSISWDPQKAATNARKHGVTFLEAATAVADPLSITIADPDHSDDEERFIPLGESHRGRLLVVVHTEHGNDVRLISARIARPAERRDYGKSAK